MTQFRNVSPLGDLDVPALGQIVEAGEVFDVPDELHDYFASQPENFAPAAPPAPPEKPGKPEKPEKTEEPPADKPAEPGTDQPAEGETPKEGDQ